METLRDVLSARLETLRAEISRASPGGEFPGIVGVTKGRSDADALALFEAGLRHLSENRWESLGHRIDFFQRLPFQPFFHFIGALQRRSIRQGYRPVYRVETIDRPSILPALAREAGRSGIRQEVLLEINLTGIAGRSGVRDEEVEILMEECQGWPELSVSGFLVMGPPPGNREASLAVFRQGRVLYDRFFPDGGKTLSMGMTDDFREAVAAGSTEIRIGRYFFEKTGGEREPVVGGG